MKLTSDQLVELFDNASVHAISQILIDFGSFAVNPFKESMATSFEMSFKVNARQILDKSNFDNSPNLSHDLKVWIINVKPQRIFQDPFHHGMIQGMDDRSNKQGFTVNSWKMVIFPGFELLQEYWAEIEQEFGQLGVTNKVSQALMLGNFNSYSLIENTCLKKNYAWNRGVQK